MGFPEGWRVPNGEYDPTAEMPSGSDSDDSNHSRGLSQVCYLKDIKEE